MHDPLTTPTAVGRLAPSPTGGLHIGHARTFLAAWLAARGEGGRVILRMDDIDAGRVRPGAAEDALRDLRWLGLDWDEGPDLGGPSAPYAQSLRLDLYRDALRRLRDAERVYPCTCTRADISRAASAPHAGEEGPAYPGTCSGRSADDAGRLGDRPFAWRFRVPPGAVAWDDLVQGPLALDPAGVGGDFVVFREGSGPAYQLASAVDEGAMGVNQVVRGADLIPSTPRQVLIQRALGLDPPRFGHVPLVEDEQGRRLAKRDGSVKLATLRDQGVQPERLVATLAASLGIDLGELTVSRPGDLVGRLELRSVPSGPFVLESGAFIPPGGPR